MRPLAHSSLCRGFNSRTDEITYCDQTMSVNFFNGILAVLLGSYGSQVVSCHASSGPSSPPSNVACSRGDLYHAVACCP